MPLPPLSTVWTLSGPGGSFTAANAGVTDITRKRATQAADTCTIQFDGRACDAPPPFPFGATVTVARDGVTWFAGRVTSNPSSGNDRSEAQLCVLSGPWWYLAQLVYQQQWNVQGGAATAWSSRLVLGQAIDGSRLTTGQVITAALQYAIDAGAPFAIGLIEPAFDAPLDEVKDVTCAEVIRAMLRWHPDGVAWFDYTTAPVPTFHCRARASLPATTLAIGAPPLAAVQGLTARHDLQVPAVVLHFETTSRANGRVQTDVVTDVAPAGATGREFGAVVGTIPLRGANAIVLSQQIVTQVIVDDVSQPDLGAQLAARSPVLAMYAADPAITAAGITITHMARSVGTGGGSAMLPNPTLCNALVAGQITDWMLADYGLHAQTQTQTFSYTLDRDSGGGDPREASITFQATDAVTGLYTTLSTYQPGDAAPTGLAAAYLAALSPLQYSGTVVLVEPEAGGVAGAALGNVINLTGGVASDWAAMRAAVVAETVSVADGTTTLTLGPSGELSVAGLSAALQTTRAGAGGRSPAALGTASSQARVTGVPG